ncbi:thioesterase II family protein [Streptomyces sp. NPDC101194]|uniref:thioesterase II family protein n=1 Tax=Streptomyces sp. NPDC101194 TaxID=3366127 RepID=UPI0038197C04
MVQENAGLGAAWFHTGRARPDAACRLYVFHHAGGSAATYARWAQMLPDDVEVAAVQLPGRQNRRATPAFTDLDDLVEAVYEALEDDLDGRRFAFFGHSMGALIAYRLTLALQKDGAPAPALLAVSGWEGSAHRPSPVPVDRLSDEEFLSRVEEFGGLPPEVTGNRELLDLVLPTLRADFTVVNGYTDDRARVDCPVVAYGGASDPLLGGGAMGAWADRADAFLGLNELPGGHFYIYEQAMAVAADLARRLRRGAAGPRRG